MRNWRSTSRPFRTLTHAPMGMTCHVVFEAWDRERPATLSPTVIGDIIRGAIGFDGLLMTDDIDMKALSGTAGEKAAGAWRRGATSCSIAGRGWTRWSRSPGCCGRSRPSARAARSRDGERGRAPQGDFAELIAKRDALLALA